ncbi:hypothetical protein MPSI1_002420 [Malassezia psittaci]|uniref:Zinc finger PHD-type domain-containing protein n=1 Tax=Malassezia psittaci TaxID=1821823 RepID=A0AAF0JL03_9BASI|nr:hypothetical protein MPSI1_002420 [Malassezia psittaci]
MPTPGQHSRRSTRRHNLLSRSSPRPFTSTKAPGRSTKSHQVGMRTQPSSDKHPRKKLKSESKNPLSQLPHTTYDTWGRTQYVLRSCHGRAQPAMRSTSFPDPPSPALQSEPRHSERSLKSIDPMTHVTKHPSEIASTSATPALCATHVQGLGRVMMPPTLLKDDPNHDESSSQPHHSSNHSHAPFVAPLQWPDSPTNAWSASYKLMENHAMQRRRCIAHWLANESSSESESETQHEDHEHPSYANQNSLASDAHRSTFHHPMVAKLLRDQCRKHRVRKLHPYPPQDWWIAADGRRIPRSKSFGLAKRRLHQRSAHTAYQLAAHGIAPVMGCRCGFLDAHMDMVQCDGCSRWLHLACVGVNHVDQLSAHDWVCDDCYEYPAGIPSRPVPSPQSARGLASHVHSSTMLSLAPSPHRGPFTEQDPSEAGPLHSNSELAWIPSYPTSDSDRAWRTPSPPPASNMEFLTTPSRHVPPDMRIANDLLWRRAYQLHYASPRTTHEFIPTPSRYLMQTPRATFATPTHDVHTPSMRLAHDWPNSVLLNTPQTAYSHPATPSSLGTASTVRLASYSGSDRSGKSKRNAWVQPESPTQATRAVRLQAGPTSPLSHRATHRITPRKDVLPETPHKSQHHPTPPSTSSPLFGSHHEDDSQLSMMPSSSPYPTTPTHIDRTGLQRGAIWEDHTKYTGDRIHMRPDRTASQTPPHRTSRGLLPSLSSYVPGDSEMR